ncbi:MAG: SUMF1/EgtB/PvdO family nonheme iron enzyme [Marinicella sp.]
MEQTLKQGVQISHWKIQKVLGIGGFGVTYLAQDERLDRLVAIKEYLPAELGIRDSNTRIVHPRTGSEENYKFGLDKFLEEAKVLAQFNHPNIVRVQAFEEANNTAYLIMDYEQGEDLSDYLKRTGFKGNMPETELKGYLIPILKGLQAVHEKGLLHRDVKPGNIYLRKGGEPMLVDFGAARYALGEHSKSMSAIISMGYAPPEQYSSKAKQSTASDLYAWGATAYELVTGNPPVESTERSHAIFEEEPDPLQPLSQTQAGKYSKELLSTIDQCLNIPQKKRPQSAAEVLAMLTGEKQSTGTVKIDAKERFKNTENNTGTRYVKDEERFKKSNKSFSSSTSTGDSNSSVVARKNGNLLMYVLMLLLVTVLGTGGYFGYDYYAEQQALEEQQHIAAEQERERQQQAKLKADREEQQAWDTAQSADTIASYQAYLDSYPSGKNSTEADAKLKQLETEHGNLAIKVQKLLVKLGYQIPTDGQLDTRTEESIKAFEKSQGLIVTGKADQVLLNSLEQAYREQDIKAWEQALNTNTITAYQEYQNNYSDGQFVGQVDSKIALVRQALADAEAEEQRKETEAENERQRLAKIAEEKRQMVAAIQTELKRLNFPDQSTNGVLDSTTTNRIKAYQKGKKQSQTGEATQTLLAQLKSEIEWPMIPGETFKDCADCPEMVVIPTGSFSMGSNEDKKEQPIHIVNIKQFAMSTTEVTFAQWDACYNAGGCSQKADDYDNGRGSRPVVDVNWNDAKEYVKWLSQKTNKNFRLPSEAEWEYAARAGSTTKYSWGDSIGSNKANCKSSHCGSYDSFTSPVKSFNANAFGLYDMHGNVWEWVEDCWNNSYSGAPNDGGVWENGNCIRRVVRGGGWISFASSLRSAKRIGKTSNRYADYGFRVVQDL